MNRKTIYTLIALLVFGVSFILSGFINNHRFQKAAVVAVKRELRYHFTEQGEKIENFLPADYSLDQIEIGVKTNVASYYVVAGVTNSIWVTFTGLNLFIKPRVEIVSINRENFGT